MAVEKEVEALWRNYSFHGGDLVIMLLEISINSMPFIPSHVLIVYFVCLLYLAEAHLVHFLSGEWIYPFLDTTVGPIWVAMYFGVGVAIGCAFGGMYFLHRGRNWWFARRAAAKVVRDASAANVETGETAVPEMVVVTSSIPTVHPGTHLQSTFSSSAAPLPSGTVLISTTGSSSAGNYVLSSNSNNYSHSRHHNSIMTHTNTSTALFPTAAPPSTILTSGGAPAGFTPTLQPLSIPTQILIQSRRRSYSNCSNDSTTSTLVGSDEGMTNKDKEKDLEGAAAAAPISEKTVRRLSMNGGGQPQADASGLQKVDEEEDGCETETEGDR
ncbi:hypothetical protein BGZ97_010832 [Linnemannia gamsii]|uniref:Uncharacterized protein n=1 Tax=Linnemannia gamsii TaxID=64522 RepID=A0A9P6RM30_9FUNG|nr:hypothetical protein BGZ97_010832 [Linnemannia gamsii]